MVANHQRFFFGSQVKSSLSKESEQPHLEEFRAVMQVRSFVGIEILCHADVKSGSRIVFL
jgi:hypothetical protein